jgi:ADP-heptose:LPS heptosyltransferase
MNAEEILKNLKIDCYHYNGDLPCGPHRRAGKTCSCDEYLPVKGRGVIIKLGAAGDVIRTTPLLRALDPMGTGTKILWVTHSPELMPPGTCEAVKPTAAVMARIAATEWDFCWNLDKDIEACAIASQVKAKEYAGYTLRDGVPYPVDERAWHKFATGLDDPYSKKNSLSYVQEIFDIVGLPYRWEEYWLREPASSSKRTAEEILPSRGWVGLNTGAGWRWPTRIWPEENWAALIAALQGEGLKPVILGGPEEVEMNDRLAGATGCLWPGVKSLDVFYAMVSRCDALVTSVTQAMHLAIAARVPLVLFNNIFNKAEFELYGRGEIVGPQKPCDCFYDAICQTGRNCVREITVDSALFAVKRALTRNG